MAEMGLDSLCRLIKTEDHSIRSRFDKEDSHEASSFFQTAS